MHDKTEQYGERDPADPAGHTLFAKESGKAQNSEGEQIVQQNAGDQAARSQSPAEKTVHNALNKLYQCKQKGYPQSGLDAAPDGE